MSERVEKRYWGFESKVNMFNEMKVLFRVIISSPFLSFVCVFCRTTRWLSTAANVAELSAVAENKDGDAQNNAWPPIIVSAFLSPTDSHVLKFWSSGTTRNHSTKRDLKKRKNEGREEQKSLWSVPTIMSKWKNICLYIDFIVCCLTTGILQSYTVFANVQFKMFVQKK